MMKINLLHALFQTTLKYDAIERYDKVFPFTTNANIKNGDGMALAYRAGAALKDMEFVQYHPTGLPFTGILITEAARSEGGWLLNKEGYRYLQDYNLGKPEQKPGW